MLGCNTVVIPVHSLRFCIYGTLEWMAVKTELVDWLSGIPKKATVIPTQQAHGKCCATGRAFHRKWMNPCPILHDFFPCDSSDGACSSAPATQLTFWETPGGAKGPGAATLETLESGWNSMVGAIICWCFRTQLLKNIHMEAHMSCIVL